MVMAGKKLLHESRNFDIKNDFAILKGGEPKNVEKNVSR